MNNYRILFLTNNENATKLIDWLKEQGENIEVESNAINLQLVKKISPSIIISYNYNYLIRRDVIEYMEGNIVNLHISLLPWNKGFSPNLWSFLDNTPKGVTVHYINEGLDTGDIIVQKEISFNEEIETFESSYNKLNYEIVELFKVCWNKIKTKSIDAIKQTEVGSYHTKKDLEIFQEKTNLLWNENIALFKRRIEILYDEYNNMHN